MFAGEGEPTVKARGRAGHGPAPTTDAPPSKYHPERSEGSCETIKPPSKRVSQAAPLQGRPSAARRCMLQRATGGRHLCRPYERWNGRSSPQHAAVACPFPTRYPAIALSILLQGRFVIARCWHLRVTGGRDESRPYRRWDGGFATQHAAPAYGTGMPIPYKVPCNRLIHTVAGAICDRPLLASASYWRAG